MRAKQIYEFTRGGDPLDTLDIEYADKIRKFFDNLGIDRDNYIIRNKQIITQGNLNLGERLNLVKLPDNLFAINLDLFGCINLVELPNNLIIDGYLNLFGCTGLTKLPEDLQINGNGCIHVYGGTFTDGKTQKELIEWIRSSKWSKKLQID